MACIAFQNPMVVHAIKSKGSRLTGFFIHIKRLIVILGPAAMLSGGTGPDHKTVKQWAGGVATSDSGFV